MIHARKSDIADAQLITSVALVEPAQLRQVQMLPAGRASLADLQRVRAHLVIEWTATINLLHGEPHRAYPSYRQLLRDPWCQAAQHFRARYSTLAPLLLGRLADLDR